MPLSRILAVLLLASLALVVPANAQSPGMYDAVTYNTESKKYYFFFGDFYVVKRSGEKVDGRIKRIEDGWEGFDKLGWGAGGVDAVLFNSDNSAYYFFKGNQYARYTYRSGSFDDGYPRSLDRWEGMPFDKIDAALYKSSTSTYYFFSGDRYARKKRGREERVELQTRSVTEAWEGLDGSKTILGAVFKPSDPDRYYFFYGDGIVEKIKGERASPYRGSMFQWEHPGDAPWVGLASDAGYVTRFEASCRTGGGSRSWGPIERQLGWSRRIKLPADATDVKVTAWVVTLGTPQIFSQTTGIPPNSYYKTYGTVFDPKWTLDPRGGTVDKFGSWVEGAAGSISDWTEDRIAEFGESRLVEEAQRKVGEYGPLIRSLSEAALAAVNANPQTFVDFGGQLAAAATGSRTRIQTAEETTRQIFSRDARLANLLSEANRRGFRSGSCAVAADAAKVVGAGGALGGAVQTSGNDVSLFGGGGARVATEIGGAGGVEFGLWMPAPGDLDGAYTTVAVSANDGEGRSIEVQAVFTVPVFQKFEFLGFSVTAAAGVNAVRSPATGAVSVGYQWLIE